MKLSSLLVAVSAVSAQFFPADFDALAHKKPNKNQSTPVDKVSISQKVQN